MIDGFRIVEGLGYHGVYAQGQYRRDAEDATEAARNAFPHSVLTVAQMTQLRATAGQGPCSSSHMLTLARANSASLAVCTYSYAQVNASLGLKNALEYLTWGYMLTASQAYEAAAISASMRVATVWSTSFPEGEIYNIRSTVRILARTYDAFYPAMTPSVRSTVLAAVGTWGEALHGFVKNYLSTSGEFVGPVTFNHLIYLGQAAVAVYNQLPAARGWMQTVEGFFLNSSGYAHAWPFWKGQVDGACSQGMYYNIGNTADQFELFDAMANMGFTNMWSTSFMQNFGYYVLYSLPPTMLKFGGIGEGGLNLHALSNAQNHAYTMLQLSRVYGDETLRWWCAMKSINGASYSVFHTSRAGYPWWLTRHSAMENLTTSLVSFSTPTALPNYRTFADTGFAFMSNDIDNISASSMLVVTSRPFPMGACGHAVQDNNSFLFYHNNEPLIIRSGQYVDRENVTQDSVHHVYWGMEAKSSNMVTLVRDTQLAEDMAEKATSSICVADGTIFAGYPNTYPTIWHPESFSAPGLDPERETPKLTSYSGNNLYFTRGTSTTSLTGQQRGTYWKAHASGSTIEMNMMPYHDYDNDKKMGTASGMQVVFSASETWQYWVGDNTSAWNNNKADMMSCSRRHVVFVSDATHPYAVFIDQVEAAEAWKFRTYLHAYNTWSFDTTSNTATANCTFSYASVVLVDGTLGGTFSMVATEESDPPIRHTCSIGEKPQDSWSEANQLLYGMEQHFWATTHTYSATWYVGMVVYPYLSGSVADVPVIAGTYSDTHSFQIYVGSTSFDFSLAATPSVTVTFPEA